jgi:uncharacterized protein (TIGR02145 family)
MKKLYTLLALVLTLITFAQAPQGFNYQATVRNSSGALIVNQNVNFKFNVMLNSATSLPIFSETHLAPTDDLGQVNLVIGQGTATTGSFSTINWGTGNYYLGIELNTGNGFVAMGTTQLLSVPYALYANSAGNLQATTPNLASVLAVNNSANNTKITNLANPTNAQDAVTKSYVDALNNNSSLMKFNGWDNYQVWSDNSTFQLQPNSFLFLNANNTTLIFPNNTSNFGDVIYVYVMQKELPNVNLQANGPALIAVPDNSAPNDFYSTSSGTITGKFKGGLNTIVQVGDYWMVGDFEKTGTFPSVAIGTQIWSTTNLDVTTYRDGTPIPQVTDPTAWSNLTTGAWCYYNNNSVNGTTYGKLYNWYAVAGIHDNDPNTPNKVLAPLGWHVPSDSEWSILINHLDPNANGGQVYPNIAGGKMKSTGTTLWVSPNTGATNLSGFTGLPGGKFGGNNTFYGISTNGNWWSSTAANTLDAWYRYINFDNTNAASYFANKSFGLSVRCVKD